jgi:hypothetical protein
MLKQKRSFYVSIVMAALTLGLVGCGSKVGGTYTFSQTGQSVMSGCSTVTLNLTSNSNQVSANGSNGQCTEMLTGYDNGNGTITVQSLTMTLTATSSYNNNNYGNQTQVCTYTGTLNVSGNVVTGQLQAAQSASMYGSNYQSSCSPITINGTKNN